MARFSRPVPGRRGAAHRSSTAPNQGLLLGPARSSSNRRWPPRLLRAKNEPRQSCGRSGSSATTTSTIRRSRSSGESAGPVDRLHPCARRVQAQVRSQLSAQGRAKVNVIAHSMGGLIVREAVERTDARRRGGRVRSVCLAAGVSGGLKSHSVRGPGPISEGGGNASPARVDGRYGEASEARRRKPGHG